MSASDATLNPSELAAARSQADRYHRSGGMTLLGLAAFWGVAAALYQWAGPATGQIALLLGSVAAHPIAWLVLRLAGGHAFLPCSNPLGGLYYASAVIPVIGVVGAAALATERDDAFFASAMLGLAAASCVTAWLYERPAYLLVAAVEILLPVTAWYFAPGVLPWFGLVGIAVLVLAGGLLLRRTDPRVTGVLPDAAGQGDRDQVTLDDAEADAASPSEPDAREARNAPGTPGEAPGDAPAAGEPSDVGQRRDERTTDQFFDQTDTKES